MANDYSTPTDAFADLPEGNYSTTDNPQMVGFITAASRLIDLECGVGPGFFYPTTDTRTLYYDGNGEAELDIDPMASVASVSVSEQGGLSSSDYTAWAATDYIVWPHNYSVKGKPVTKLIVDTLNGTKPCWYGYRKAVKVTGIMGYATSTPPTIAQACRMQAVRWFMRAKQGYQDVGASVEIGGLTVKGQQQLDPDVKALLWPYKLELS